eukprot:CAMPEP_0119103170 /NCGR_PEP_ID=MMETSP1180-20130426/1685_1 /TAXON_ID=3052 ORGANISM="Chlamydomonas cf sp, Strain CCMP681" /NCGR_SAMPLE_ID=MMETSP1180 /ASSEMBLY_ACC=CAM_ASM_000741 /LENGTH=344 /DNA_ID=CAMNT_0007087615 /DNA_START=123 /DNA_END=1157 /DNA_ORIENTATION=+
METAFSAPSIGFKGLMGASGLELLSRDEQELCSMIIYNDPPETGKKSSVLVTEDPGCCACLSCCSCLSCCFSCCSSGGKLPSGPSQNASNKDRGTCSLMITDQRIVLRHVDESATSTAAAQGAAPSSGCCMSLCCCCCDSAAPPSSAAANGNLRKTTEEFYLASDLKDVKFIMFEARDRGKMVDVVERSDCCSPNIITTTTTDNTKIRVEMKLAFVKKVGDYAGPWWGSTNLVGIKSSQTIVEVSGWVTDFAKAHELRRAVMMHSERLKPSVSPIGTINLNATVAAGASDWGPGGDAQGDVPSPGDGSEAAAGGALAGAIKSSVKGRIFPCFESSQGNKVAPSG